MDPLKRRHNQSKKQTIYGIFASDDSDSEPERSGFGGREAGFKRKGANYSAPITFVSGGVKAGAGASSGPKENNEEVDQISDDEDDKSVLRSLRPYHDSDSDSPNSDIYRKPDKPVGISVGASRRVAAAAAAAKSATSGFGAWERHTKGIGMKLLEQMGYEPGKGLGSDGRGIVTPVQAVQRVGKVSVGYYGSEKAPAPRRGNETVVEGSDSVGPRYKKRPGLQRSQALKPIQDELSKVKVIDMTSKEQKVYSGYEAALSRVVQRRRKPGDNSTLSDEENPDVDGKRIEKRLEGNFFDCPALRHNFALIMRSAEDEIRRFDRAARFEEDRAVGLEHEIEKLTEIVDGEESEVNHLKKALFLIKKFEDEVTFHSGCDTNLTSEAISSWVSLIREECANLVEMPVLMASIARPMLDNSLARWDPLKLNPAKQNMDPWNWVMRWADLIGPAVLVNLLEHHFWSRWLSVLSSWLNQGVEARQRGDHTAAGQVYQEVGRWYAGWKGQLPPECMEYASVKDALTKALAMMERSMRGLPPQVSKQGQSDVSRYPAGSSGVLPPAFGSSTPLVAPPPTTLRKQVEQVAAQRGFLFHPISNRMFEGQQVYRLESLQVFFDRNVSYVYNPSDGGWLPVTFAELMTRAQY
ncbi:tuftelin-interacting protein 11 [Schistosoma bovis]|uniref:Tuftelin-interacting protein 11 n=1 Tax=Schistosoma bovis TaxID=6184 RepID=A0A430QJX2_SCHBO|nr:tuftelin-interacting protein 11 [Schistosoma bovis]